MELQGISRVSRAWRRHHPRAGNFFLPPLDHGVESGGFWLRLVLHAAVEIAGVEGRGGRAVNCSCGAVPGAYP